MKNLSLSLLFLFSIALFGCEKSNEEKAKDAIRTYLNENLDDMSAYESVKFGQLDTTMILDLIGTSSKPQSRGFRFQMFHSYRIKNDEGQKKIYKGYFLLNKELKVVSFSSNSYPLLFEARIPNPIIESESADADTAVGDTIAY
jgi:hypothetical protein